MNHVELNEKMFQCNSIVCNEKNVWGILDLYSAIISIERDSGNGDIILLPKQYLKMQYAFRTMQLVDDKLILFPFQTHDICIYNYIKNVYEIVDLQKMLPEQNDFRFLGSIRCGDTIFAFGYPDYILRYSLVTGNVEVITKWKDLVEDDKNITQWFYRDVFQDNGQIIIPFSSGKKILKYHIEKDVFFVVDILEKETADLCAGIGYQNEVYYAIPRVCKGSYVLLEVNGETKEIKRRKLDIPAFGEVAFVVGAIVNQKLWLFPARYEYAYCIDLEMNEIKGIKELPRRKIRELGKLPREGGTWWSQFNYTGGYKTEDNHFVTIYQWDGVLIDVDLVTGAIKQRKIMIDLSALRMIDIYLKKDSFCYKENEVIDLSKYCEFIIMENKVGITNKDSNGISQKIWNSLEDE